MAATTGAASARSNRGPVLDEFELIDLIRERLARAGAPAGEPRVILASGDDAAIAEHEGVTVTSVDALVEDVHFRVPPFTLANVGAKALATALSDLAAMAALPTEAYVQLGLPERYDEDALEIADGIGAVAAAHGVAVAGGDVTRSPVLFLAVTAVGSAASAEELVARRGAVEGDLVVVTGELGGAAAGLRLLERPELADRIDPDLAAALHARQLAPQPRVAAGRLLAAHGARAMIDLSDGLAGDARHLAEASAVALAIELERLPVQAGVADVAAASGVATEELTVAGGEDYELLAALSPERAEAAQAAIAGEGGSLTVIGRVESGGGVELTRSDGARYEASGYDQLRAPPVPGDRA